MQTIVITITGKVQGVFFRQSTREKALSLGITGHVRNLENGQVQVTATGSKDQLDALVDWCRKGPEKARVSGVECKPGMLQSFTGFTVVR